MQERAEVPEFELSSTSWHAALFFETPSEIFARVFRELKPRTPLPGLNLEFRPYANANCTIRLAEGKLHAKLADVFEGAPAPVMEALAYILLSKLYRKPLARQYNHRYRLYLERKDVRRQLQLVKQVRGRKFVSGPQGQFYNLSDIFRQLNEQFFHSLLPEPQLGWSRRVSKSLLGHFDPSHNAIIISRVFDRPDLPVLALEYVMFHEMLHLRYPVQHKSGRRCVHTPEFQKAEKTFPRLAEAKDLLKRL